MREIYCQECKCWIKITDPDCMSRWARREHAKVCNGDPFEDHPDLLDLENQLERYYGEI